jgi:Flp pilus assembly protein TadG
MSRERVIRFRAKGRRRTARALIADQHGGTIIEFAFVAAPLMALLMAIVVTSTVYFAQAGLETATEATARQRREQLRL